MSRQAARLSPVSPGVVRVSWSRELQEAGLDDCAGAVRRAVAEGFEAGSTRVETHVDPADTVAQRVATFSGMRREGVARGVAVTPEAAGAAGGRREDRVVYARLVDDVPVDDPAGFRALLNSFLPRKRAIAQMLVRSTDQRVLLCQLTYKRDWDLPGGVVEVGESPHLAVGREVSEELALDIPAGPLVLTDWLPPWGGWDDAVCLVYDGGVHEPAILDAVVKQAREIRSAEFLSPEQVRERCADFTARRVEAALANVTAQGARSEVSPGASYTESGRVL